MQGIIIALCLSNIKYQLEASRENAVRASITASLELLNKNEEITLFYILLHRW